ncbi:MAG: hypothetical protein LUG52_00265 [Clostridia bacterium]|nr:hypothetical protein [Clostridia bacterium]
MKKKTVIITVAILLALGVAAAAADNIVSVYFADYDVNFSPYFDDGSVSHPLLSYNGNTYAAISDVADALKIGMEKNDDEQKINLTSGKEHTNIINKEETALRIGKAILKEYCANRLGEDCVYEVTLCEAKSEECDDYWRVGVKSGEDYEAFVELNAANCMFTVTDSEKGTIVDIVDLRG